MPFEGLKQITINEQIKAPIMVDNSDKGPKYAKPELQNFHEDIIKKYEKTDITTLQKILETLDKDL